MSTRRGLLVLLVAGVLWGLSEIFLGDVFYRFHMPFRSAALTSIGIAILVVGRFIFDRPGSSFAASAITAGLRCLVPKLYICHLVAITLEGCAFDMSWTYLRAGRHASVRRAWLASAISVYAGFLSFGLISAYAFRFGRWVEAGLSGVLEYAIRSGTVSVVILAALVPLAVVAGRRLVSTYRAAFEETGKQRAEITQA
jgi:hypothetical protein